MLFSSSTASSQILATLCATLGCLLNGSVIGYTGPAIPRCLFFDDPDKDGGGDVDDLAQSDGEKRGDSLYVFIFLSFYFSLTNKTREER